ncbi:MAG TPA: HD domain-containing protein [Pseudogracilibacillus sp.]|nr:HD domain-containing protein [Pseudogracilibacillus sp.]
MNYEEQLLDEEKVFKDPVHRYVRVKDQIIWDLIATPEFQRLRRIKQLGTTNLTFHGAEHSRFNHSLGVYEIVRRMIRNMEKVPSWNKSERLVCLCAALLHDIGHGPFSHSFEKVFGFDHEAFTQEIILGNTEVNEILQRIDDDFPNRVAQVIDKTYEDQLVVSVISSQIDADRMDYLLRDAYYTGVSYGQFDMERILRVMRPTKDKVVIKSTGMHAVEDYIMSRYQMYWQVYFHPVTRSAETILVKIFDRVKYLYQSGYTFNMEPEWLLSMFKESPLLEEYLRLDESVFHFYFLRWQEESDPILSDLCIRFMNRKLFKYVNIHPDKEKVIYEQLRALFKEASIDPDYYLAIDASSDLPYDVYHAGEGRVPIYLQMPSGEEKELSSHSVIVDAISGKKRADHKLYYPAELVENINNKAVKKQIFELLHSCQAQI